MASQASFDDLLQCSICLERFTQPKLLPCAHTFCLSCLRGIVKDEKSVDCPTCRSPHQVPEKGVVGFKDNLMAINLLSMVRESAECSDCGKNQILSECEHCEQQVCADCRAAHNRIAAEVTILIQSLELGVLRNPDEKLVRVSRSSLEKTDQISTKIHVAFDEATNILNERKKEMLQQVEIGSRFQNAVAQGTGEAVVDEIRQELNSCGSKESLKRMKESLMRVEEMLSGELEFGYDVSDVARFGELRCGGETVTKETTIKRDSLAAGSWNKKSISDRKHVADTDALGAVAAKPLLAAEGATGGLGTSMVVPPRMQDPSLAASGFQAASRFPAQVDYEAKNSAWKRIFSNHPDGCGKFAPTDAVHSQREGVIYCLSSGQLLKFDIESGVGKLVCSLNASHLASTDSGSLLIIKDRNVTKLSAHVALSDPETDYTNSLQTMALRCDNAIQICCHGNEITILDSGKKSLLKLNEHGKLVREIKLNSNVSDASRMCVDREGRIYVTSVRITDRKDNEDWYRGCTSCRLSQSGKVSWEVVISILTWDGEESGQLVVGGGSQDYTYKFDHGLIYPVLRVCAAAACGSGHTYRRNNNSVPNNDQIIKEKAIRGLCVDGDGYISVTRLGKNQIDVYDPKHKLFCTIGNKETPEFEEPRGLTLMPDGRLVVCDTGNSRIQII